MKIRRTISKYVVITVICLILIILSLYQHEIDEVSEFSNKIKYNESFPKSYKNKILDNKKYFKFSKIKKQSNLFSQEPSWLKISSDLYLYSSYLDTRKDVSEIPSIKSIAIWRFNSTSMYRVENFRWTGIVKRDSFKYSCFLWYKNDTDPQKGVIDAFVFEEALNEFVGVLLTCTNVNDSNENHKADTPYAVSFLPEGNTEYPHKLIYLQNEDAKLNQSYSICVRAFYGPFHDSRSIIEFVLYYYLILNVRSFYFYEFALSWKIKEILSRMVSFGIDINLLKWNLPTGSWDELWDLGSLSLLNDCLYRTMDTSNFTLFVDLDEFIVPVSKTDQIENIYEKTLLQKRGKSGDAALVLNGFFCSDFKRSLKVKSSQNNNLTIFKYITREGRLWPPQERSKIIVKPKTVISIGHHMVHKFTNTTYKNHGVSKFIAALHHYRSCKGLKHGIHAKGSNVIDSEVINDSSMLKFKNKILSSDMYSAFKSYLSNT